MSKLKRIIQEEISSLAEDFAPEVMYAQQHYDLVHLPEDQFLQKYSQVMSVEPINAKIKLYRNAQHDSGDINEEVYWMNRYAMATEMVSAQEKGDFKDMQSLEKGNKMFDRNHLGTIGMNERDMTAGQNALYMQLMQMEEEGFFQQMVDVFDYNNAEEAKEDFYYGIQTTDPAAQEKIKQGLKSAIAKEIVAKQDNISPHFLNPLTQDQVDGLPQQTGELTPREIQEVKQFMNKYIIK